MCQQTSLFVRLLAGFPLAMVEVVIDLMVGLSTMMPHLGSSGLRIKYLLAPVRPLWAKRGLSSSYTTLLEPRSSTIMATMVSSRKKNTAKSVLRRCSCSPSQVWEHSIRIPRLSGPYKQSCIWLAPSWCIQVYTGRKWVVTIYPCGLSLLNMRFDYTTAFPIMSQALLLWNY